ncbi:Ig-like domain-containing protein [Novosphingobium sp.]|uniref:Ig-like domain-containing protein n=1 Tax=Novosphingobium sp. TaxID=1874826 RepID=UPI002C510F0A|nr:Ig-like domain-containing protein [Novosphingobium sp.]HQV04920.1 Ig-like domain-containing protein [Novosphingobium sp.]
MPSYTPLGTDTLANTNTADGQISPRVVALAGGRYMVVWVGSVTLPVTVVNGTFAPSYANADIRAQIYNADGTPSGSEIVINTTTAGAQLRPVVAQLSDGNVLISWHDGVGPSGGTAETTPNTIRAQEFTSAGVATGSEFVIGNSNGRPHAIAATADGGFVATFQEGGVGGALPAGNIVARIFNSSNVQTGSFVIDNTQPLAVSTFTTVEADGDIVVYWQDRQPGGMIAYTGARFDSSGTMLSSGSIAGNSTVFGLITLATGGHAMLFSVNAGGGFPISIYAIMYSADGSLSQTIEITQVPTLVTAPTITPTLDGGFIAAWGVDSDPGTTTNIEIMARAYNAIGNQIGQDFQLNSITTGNQSTPYLAQLTTGDIVAVWIDESQINGDSSGTGISLRRIDYDPTNTPPVADDITFSLFGIQAGVAVTEDSTVIFDRLANGDVDSDGDLLVVSGVSNVANGTVTLNPDGTLTMTANPGATERLSFDYTISDGQGGFATARATVTLPSDFLTVRPGETRLIDFLANDYYTPSGAASPFTVTLPGPVMGGSVMGYSQIVSTVSGPRVFYDPLGRSSGPLGEVDLNSAFFDLLVGQTAPYQMFYFNNEQSADIQVTVQGWAQLGGTAADTLIGTSLADHLSGGSGAANVLEGGLGNDWYTVAVAEDTIIELAGGGTDSVRTALAEYVLPENVENLRFHNTYSGINRGTGNAGNNLITASFTGAELFGLGGNDTLFGSFASDILNGGDGDDLLSGNGGIDQFDGGAGNDRAVIGFTNAGSTVIGGADTDTLTVVSTTDSLAALSGFEAVELLSGSRLTLTGQQFNDGLAFNSVFTGTGSLTVNMTAGVAFVASQMNFASVIMTTVNGTAGIDVIKAALGAPVFASGGDGIDQIRGGNLADSIFGDGGNDKLMGLGGADVLTGGAGADQFRYLFTSDSGLGTAADRIGDFTNGEDKLDFRVLDADPNTAGRQALTFIGTSAFATDGSAQVRYVDIGADTRVEIDLNGDGAADMHILLSGHAGQALSGTDFLL